MSNIQINNNELVKGNVPINLITIHTNIIC